MLTDIMIEMLPVEHENHLRNYMVKPDTAYLVVRQAIVDQVQRVTGTSTSMDTSRLDRAVANIEGATPTAADAGPTPTGGIEEEERVLVRSDDAMDYVGKGGKRKGMGKGNGSGRPGAGKAAG